VNGAHGVARSLGDFGYKEWGKASVSDQLVTCKPEILVYPTDATVDDDEFILICCDGVWDVMTSQDAVDYVHKVMEEGATDLGVALEMLLERCLELGSLDNMTAAIIAFPGMCRQYDYFRKKAKSSACTVS
jgi:serine/threonine protein phosphatase PrpC